MSAAGAPPPATTSDLMTDLTGAGFRVWIEEDRTLRVGPASKMTPEWRERIKAGKGKLTAELLVVETTEWAHQVAGSAGAFLTMEIFHNSAPQDLKDRMRSASHAAHAAAVAGDVALCQTALTTYRAAVQAALRVLDVEDVKPFTPGKVEAGTT